MTEGLFGLPILENRLWNVMVCNVRIFVCSGLRRVLNVAVR